MNAIREEQPELIALVEAGSPSADECGVYERQLPGYQAIPLAAGMMVFTRGTVELLATRRLPNRSNIHVLSCDLPLGPTNVVLADIGPDPLFNRKPSIEEVLNLANQYQAAIIMGDFNTPYDSVHFDPLRQRYRHALKSANSGPIETWPYIAPCLAIDHVWLADSYLPIQAKKRWTVRSDHAMVVVKVDR